MYNNHVLPRMACSFAILTIALAHCGCQSLKVPSGWATAWAPKPAPPKNPNDRETVTYLGMGKKKPAKPDVDELKSKMDLAGKDSKDAAFDNYLRHGNQNLRDNRLDEAKKDYEKALQLRPDHPDCHHRLAVIADKQGQFGLSDDHYEAALKARPRDPNLLSDIGYSYSLRGDDQRAESTLKQALTISASHTGAMFNLGSIYAKQGRYEETVAMFKRGQPEAQALQSVAKLFPQHPAGAPASDIALAQGTNPNNSRTDQPADLLGMGPEQLKAEMNRRKLESIDRRKQQQMAELPPRRDWTHDDPQQQRPQQQYQQAPQNDFGRTNQPIVLGPGSNPQYANAMPNNDLPTVNPNGGMNAQGYGQGAPNGYANNGAAMEQPGGKPDINVWDGASMRDPRLQPAGNSQMQGNMAGNGNQSQQSGATQAPIHYGPSRGVSGIAGLQPSVNQGSAGQSDNMAAAQLGMNLGPGGLFPVVHTDDNSQSGFGGQGQPAIESKFGSEFPSPPQFQGPAGQSGRNSMSPPDPRQTTLQSPWGGSSPPARSPSRFSDFSESEPLSPPSPTSDWQQPRVTQMGGAFPANSANTRFSSDPVERLPSGPSSTWTDKPNLNNAAPFNGSWPPGSQSSGNAAAGNNAGAGNTPVQNSIPMWNGGAPANSAQPRTFGSGNQNQPADYPEQWQFSRGR